MNEQLYRDKKIFLEEDWTFSTEVTQGRYGSLAEAKAAIDAHYALIARADLSRLVSIDYHRNGVCGLGFHVLIIRDEDRKMLVVRFDKSADNDTGSVVCAAFDLAELGKDNIAFMENSYRGDHYATIVDPLIA